MSCYRCKDLRNSAEPEGPDPIAKFEGACYAVHIEDRFNDKKNLQFTVWVEDDGTWHEKEFSGSVAWLDDIIEQFVSARTFMSKRENKANAVVRKAALAKLTEEDRHALGLDWAERG